MRTMELGEQKAVIYTILETFTLNLHLVLTNDFYYQRSCIIIIKYEQWKIFSPIAPC